MDTSQILFLLSHSRNSQRTFFQKKISGRSLVVQWVKDLSLSLQWLGLLLGDGFDPWPRNFHMPQVQPRKQTSEDMPIRIFKFRVNISYNSLPGKKKKNVFSPDKWLLCLRMNNRNIRNHYKSLFALVARKLNQIQCSIIATTSWLASLATILLFYVHNFLTFFSLN